MSRTSFLRFASYVLVSTVTQRLSAVITLDFEDLAVGTVVSAQYDGVTFSAQPGSCGGGNPDPFIVDPAGATSSGTKALSLQNGCPDFNPDYLRMVFEVGQIEVTFVLGGDTPPGTYILRAYTTIDGDAGEFFVPDVVIPAGTTDVNRFVRITRAAGDMRRIEIQDSIGEAEIIDDLTFSSDNTPPTADITSPSFPNCVCGTVNVMGVACDSDGDYGFDKLEYRVANAGPGDPWIEVGSFTTPLCGGGTLYNWNTAAVAEGWYTLLLTVENANGLQSQDSVVVQVDKHFESVVLGSPSAGAIVGGGVCITGTVWDNCFDHYFVEFRPAGGGAFAIVDPVNPQYNVPVQGGGLASWNTAALADGNYELRVRAFDTCGNTAQVLRIVTVDNTAPTAAISAPLACSYVNGVVAITGSASDAHFDRYELQYIGGPAADWINIIPPSLVPVPNGLLANWNTAGLPRCAYLVRLTVHEDTLVDCCGGLRSRTIYLPLNLGHCCDINHDGLPNGLDVPSFVSCLLLPGNPCQ